MATAPNRTASQRRPAQTQLAFHASRIIIDVGVLLAMAAMSLPFVTAPDGDRNAVDADALPVILLLLPIFLITMIPDHTRPLPTPLGWAALVLGIAALPYAVVKYIDADTLADTLGGDVAFGARLIVLGTFVTVVGIAIGLARNMLHLPQGGTYPAHRTRAPAPGRPARQSGPPPGGTARTPRRTGTDRSREP
jgi:hypothetical protein